MSVTTIGDTRVTSETRQEVQKGPACEIALIFGEGYECDNAAEWAIILSCCGNTILWCNEHMDEQLEYISTEGDILCYCVICYHLVKLLAWILKAERI